MLRKLVMYLSAFLPMFLIMWIKKYYWESEMCSINLGSILGKAFTLMPI